MKKKPLIIGIACVVGVLALLVILIFFPIPSSCDVQAIARRASVQPVFYVPVLKAYFTEPLEEEKKITEEDIEKLLEEKIKVAIEEEREKQSQDKYQSYLTPLEIWGYEGKSKTQIPLGALCPKWAKFPKRILVVYKVEKKEISAWEKEHEKDVLAISELANVSPSVAQDILLRLKTEGYSITKEEIDIEAEVKLLWFDDGWDDSYPTELDWKVTVEGTDKNIIAGYDPRGILTVNPIPEKSGGNISRIHIKAGYFDLKDEFKPKSDEIKTMESEIEKMKKELEEKERAIEKYEKKEDVKRDIGKATWLDVSAGTVKVEQFWMMSAASGVYLGNMKVKENFTGFEWEKIQWTYGEKKGVVLTNAHVARNTMELVVYVTEDKETLWVFFPGIPYIRYTQDSDLYGSPAAILAIDDLPVLSSEVDTAIMVTSEIPNLVEHKAILGDSDNVREGDEVVMCGNPGYLQKFLTRGIVSNKSYDVMKSLLAGRWLRTGMGLTILRWLTNSSFWFDTPIGIGGTSGSGVWAMEGPEKGKVIALHNMGLMVPTLMASAKSEDKQIGFDDFINFNGPIKNVLKEDRDEIFKHYSHKEANFQIVGKEFGEKEPTFKEALEKCGGWVDVAGMNAGIPINLVKRYLQERGLNPEDFDWEMLPKEYWEN